MNTTPLDSDRLAEDCPQLQKIFVDIDDSDEELDLTVGLPLDDNVDSEARAKEVYGDILYLRFRVNLNLEAEREKLSKLLAKMYDSQTVFGERLRAPSLQPFEDHELKTLLWPMAKKGREIFFELFLASEPVNKPADELNLMHEVARSVFSREHLISITSPVPLFPWAFLFYDPSFDATNKSTFDPLKFWGFRHEVQEQISEISESRRFPHAPTIVAAIDSDIEGAGLHQEAEHPLTKLGDEVKPVGDVNALGTTLANFTDDCFYFFGHADHEDPPSKGTSWIKLRGAELDMLTLANDHRAPSFTKKPVLLFLNGCRTNPLSVWDDKSVAGYLCERSDHRVCCLLTVAEIPEAFAVEFARRFLDYFFVKRLRVGSALLTTRREMIRGTHKNPLGLLYTFLGNVELQLKETADE